MSAPAQPSHTASEESSRPLLRVVGLKVYFRARRRRLSIGAAKQFLKAVDDVSFEIGEGETLGLVGESGCGKTTLGKALSRLLKPTAGTIEFAGEDITALKGTKLRERRRHFQMIFQDPLSTLDPRWTIEQSLMEGVVVHGLEKGKGARRQRAIELLRQVGLDPAAAVRYPHEFSGGQRQRIGIARALAVNPRLIVCDEPVAALDVSVQAQIINVLRELQERRRIAYLFIAHDLAVVEHISHRVMVMYLGRIVELAPARQLISDPKHPYTQALISAVPTLESPGRAATRIVLAGEVPSPLNPPSGCPFHTRCPRAQFPRCSSETPVWRELTPGHWTSCHFADAPPR